MFPYLIRLAIWLTIPITLLSLLMPALGQMNPHRDWIVYWANQPGLATYTLHDLERRIGIHLSEIPYSHAMDFSTQGKMAYAAVVDNHIEVRVFDMRSSVNNPQVIYTNPPSTQFFHFIWSPDGRYLAFIASEDNQTAGVYVWNGESVETLNLPDMTGYVSHLVWSPDNLLAYRFRQLEENAGQYAPADLYLWDGQQTVNLSQTPDKDERLGSWSQDGRLVSIAAGLNVEEPLTILIWDGSNSTLVLSDLRTLNWLAWNTQNELTLSGTFGNDANSQFYRWDGAQVINISPDSQLSYGYYTWSQDGRWAASVQNLTTGYTTSIRVWHADQQLLLDILGVPYGIWTEEGSLLFCKRQAQGGVVLQHWDGEQVRPVIQGNSIYTLVPNAAIMNC